MIIRPLRLDENGKAFAVRSVGYGFAIDVMAEEKKPLETELIGAFEDDGETLMAIVGILPYMANYCGEFVPALGIGHVATRPEYRRCGAVRRIMDYIFAQTEQRGWVTSFLHPFSFDYYRRFGYERLVKRMRMRVKSAALSVVERNFSAKLYSYENPERLSDVLSVYNAYARRHGSMFLRDESTDAYPADPFKSGSHTYVHYREDGTPDGVAVIRVTDEVRVDVDEICYTDAKGLHGILGFLRVYDGQVKDFYFNNLPETSELELVLGEYTMVEYAADNRAMGRVMQVEEALKKNAYPDGEGRFRLRCEDTLPCNRAVFEVVYRDGTASVTRLPYEADYDISATVPPLSRFMLQGGFDAERAAYLAGVDIRGDAEDFFRAFPDRDLFIPDFF